MSTKSNHEGEPWVDAHGNLGATGGAYYIRDGAEKTVFSRRTKIVTAAIILVIVAFAVWLGMT